MPESTKKLVNVKLKRIRSKQATRNISISSRPTVSEVRIRSSNSEKQKVSQSRQNSHKK